MATSKRFLTTPGLVLITLVAIINLRNIPIMAEQGMHALLNYGIAAIAFLIPSALICAQNASQYPQAGGVYHWVQEGFGDNWGFFTIWSEWFNNLIGFPATLIFICATFLGAVMPNTAEHTLYLMFLMFALLWAITYLNCRGIELSTRLSMIGAVLGTLIPAIIISVIAIHYGLQHGIHWPAATPKQHHNWYSMLAVLVTCIAGYSGMQVTAFHTPNIIKPRVTLPKALILSIVIILLLTVLPTLAIILIVPAKHLNMITGLSQCLTLFFQKGTHHWVSGLMITLICIGTITSLSTWMLAPARGLLQSTRDRFLPAYFAKTNRQESPTRILVMQAVVATLLIVWLYSCQHLTQGFWILAVLTSQFTLIMYILVFATSIKNRWHAKKAQAHNFQMSRFFTVVFSGLGIAACLLGYIISFSKPSFLTNFTSTHYHHDLLVATIVYIIVPIIIILKRNRKTTSTLHR
jgi:amino acid transporter